MKYTFYYLILFLLLIFAQFFKCKETVAPQDQPIYYNSFEQPSDLEGWIGLNAASLVDDAPSTGGKRSVYISGGCVMPTASCTIAPSGEDQEVLIHCYGKNLSWGGNVVLHIGDDYNFENSISVGDTIWRFESGSRSEGAFSSSVMDGGSIYVADTENYKYYRIDAKTGEVKWEYTTDEVDIKQGPQVHNNLVYGRSEKDIIAIETNTGKLKWKYQLNTQTPLEMAIYSNIMFFAQGVDIILIDTNTGAYLDNLKISDNVNVTPIVLNNTLYIYSGDNYLYAIKTP